MRKSLKIIFMMLTILLLSVNCWADSSRQFIWDANSESDLAGYRLYQSDTAGQYEFGSEFAITTIPKGSVTTTLKDIPEGIWFFVVTAYDDSGNESVPSNEVSAKIDNTSPAAPTTLRIKRPVTIIVE